MRNTILPLLLLFALTLVGCHRPTQPEEPKGPAYLFALATDTTFVLLPTQTDSGYAMILPAYWDASQLVCRPNSPGSLWQSIEVSLGERTHDILFLQSAQPSLFICTESGTMDSINASLDKSVKEKGTIRLILANGEVEYDGPLKSIKGRGNTSWRESKKPYNIQLKEREKLLNLKKASKFCLLATLGMTEFVCMNISKEFGTASAISCHYVSLYLNGQYNGLYLITNKVDVDKSNINISDLSKANQKGTNNSRIIDEANSRIFWHGKKAPSDITGGYLIEVLNFKDRYFNVESGFIGRDDNRVEIKSPEKSTEEEVLYIQQLFNEFYDANQAPDGIHPTLGRPYSDYIDLPSFARYYLIEEVLANMDGTYGNLYFYKDRDSIDSRLFAGPVWDMSSSLGANVKYPYNHFPQSLHARAGSSNERHKIIYYLLQHPDFRRVVNKLYQEELRPILQTYFFGGKLRQEYDQMAIDLACNEALWPNMRPDEYNCIMAYMLPRIQYMDYVFGLKNEDDICQVSVNGGFNRRNIMYLVKRGDTFCLPNPADMAMPQSDRLPDGWYQDRDTLPLNSDTQVITSDTFFELRWKNDTVATKNN